MTPAGGRAVTIGCSATGLDLRGQWSAVVVVDVIRSATTAVTAVARGRRCFPTRSIEASLPLAARLENPLLAGELGGAMPYGFDMQNSPAGIDRRADVERPVILLSTSGTRVMHEAAESHTVYAACLRNAAAQARHLAALDGSVLLVGAETRGEFREEDRLCCARIAGALVDAGHRVGDALSERIIERWGRAPDDAFVDGASAAYLRRTDQHDDLEFILGHVDDLDAVFEVSGEELVTSGRA